jgi:hypothetical protein
MYWIAFRWGAISRCSRPTLAIKFCPARRKDRFTNTEKMLEVDRTILDIGLFDVLLQRSLSDRQRRSLRRY